jgi:hypothetical protein
MSENRKKIRDVPLIGAIVITLLFVVFLFLSDIFTIFLAGLNLDFIAFLLLHFAFRFFTQVILVLLILALLLGFITNKRFSDEFLPFMRLSKGILNTKAIIAGILAFLSFT